VFPPASDQSVEKAITLMRDEAAIGFTARTASANTGPMISSAPSSIASLAAVAASLALARVSLGMIWKLLCPRSNRASCAAFSIDWPSFACLPLNGTSRATFTGGKLLFLVMAL